MSLSINSQGKAVADVQSALARAGFSSGDQSGVFGSATEGAVRAFQSAKGLVADGIVGDRTWRALGLKGSAPKAVAID